jgi:two-component system, LuxR family, sensor kinase FixL
MTNTTAASARNKAARGSKSRTKVSAQSAAGSSTVSRARMAARPSLAVGLDASPNPPPASAKRLRTRAERRLCKTRREVAEMPVDDVQKLVHELQVHHVELEMQNDELRRTQLELEQARDRYSDLFDFAPAAYLTLSADGAILEANLRAGELLGLERSRLIRQKFSRFVPGGNARDAFYLFCRQVFRSSTRQSVELDLMSAKSKRLVIQLEAVRDPTCPRQQLRVSLNDITEQKRVKEAMSKSEERYRVLFASSRDAIMTVEPPAWKFTSANPATVAMFRTGDVNRFVATAPWELSPEFQPDGRPSIEAAKAMIQMAMRQGSHFFEWRHKRLNGEEFPASVLLARVELEGRTFLQATVRDITERKRAEERIAQLSRVQAILAGIERAIVHIPDRQKLLDEVCRVAVENGGFKLAWIGMVAPNGSVQPVAAAGATGYLEGICVMTQDVPHGRGLVGAAIRESRPVVIENVDHDTRMAPWQNRALKFGLHYVAAFPIRIEGKVAGAFQFYAPRADFFDENELGLLTQVSDDISFALTAVSDLTARKQAEEALRRSEHNLSSFFNNAPIGLEWLSAGGTILRANQAQLDLLGYSPQEYLGHFFGEFCTDPVNARELLERLAANETVRGLRMRRRRKDGGARLVLVDAQPLRNENQFLYSSIFSRDITERANLEQEILEISEREHRRIAQDLHDGLGQLLVGTAYLGSTLRQDLVAKSLPEVEQLDRLLRLLDEAIGQTRGLARGLHPVKPEPNGLMAALQELALRTKTLFQVGCRFTCRQPVLIEDNATATHLYRIAQEAVTNAIKHGEPGLIQISLTRTTSRINLAVKDNGVGLPTRLGKQRGMGFRIMRYRAGAIGGSLAIWKEPRGGTTVICSVPQPAEGAHDYPERATRKKD